MARAYRLTPEAEADLIQAWRYIAADSTRSADAFLEKVDRKCETLAEFPYMGRTRDDLGTGIYSFPVGNYLIYYQVVEDGIRIGRILHSARDILDQF